jgi:hypothetical protein
VQHDKEEEEMRIRSSAALVVMLALVMGWGTSPALADYGYSTVQAPPGGELAHAAIFGNVYGGTFTGSGTNMGDDVWTIYSNGSITAYRVFDFDDENEYIHIVNGDQTDVDQIWTDGEASVTAAAKYASYEQSFGWNGGGLGQDYIELLTHLDVGNGPVELSIPADPFLWGNRPNGYEWWSKNSYNSDDDHMVSYYIDGASVSGETVWMVFWEDVGSGTWDQDYNDFVIEIRAIPEPGSMLLFGLGTIALLRKRKT